MNNNSHQIKGILMRVESSVKMTNQRLSVSIKEKMYLEAKLSIDVPWQPKESVYIFPIRLFENINMINKKDYFSIFIFFTVINKKSVTLEHCCTH